MKTTIEKLTAFVNQRPGLDFSNYGDVKSYRSEMREITADRNDYFELLSLAHARYKDKLNEVLTEYLKKSSGRLTLNENGNLEYCTGQYWCTEYRPAANRVLVNLIFADYRDEKDSEGNPIYKDGAEMRKAIKRSISRRIGKNYFN